MRVLVVEDDEAIAESLAEGLRLQGFDPVVAGTGRAALAGAGEADVVLLDLGLPDLDGLEICRRLSGAVPVIVVSARDDELDRVLGLELGADDYVVKPFSLRELAVRIRKVHERAGTSDAAEPGGGYSLGSLRVDERTRRAVLDDQEIVLTPKEFDLLALLASDPGTVFRRETLIERVWDMNWFGSTKTLDVHVAALRHKLGDPGWIETVRGVGFRAVAVR